MPSLNEGDEVLMLNGYSLIGSSLREANDRLNLAERDAVLDLITVKQVRHANMQHAS